MNYLKPIFAIYVSRCNTLSIPSPWLYLNNRGKSFAWWYSDSECLKYALFAVSSIGYSLLNIFVRHLNICSICKIIYDKALGLRYAVPGAKPLLEMRFTCISWHISYRTYIPPAMCAYNRKAIASHRATYILLSLPKYLYQIWWRIIQKISMA